jgi:hypothetical protein
MSRALLEQARRLVDGELIASVERLAVRERSEAAILDRALSALLTELVRKKFAISGTPRSLRNASEGSGHSRHIPAEVKRAVFLRDRGRCAFVSAAGHRCGERAFLEFHHVHPHAHDGPATVSNIELRCRRHNAHEWQMWSVDLETQLNRAAAGVPRAGAFVAGRAALRADRPAG